MEKSKDTLYPPTDACKKYLEIRQAYEGSKGSRKASTFFAAAAGMSGLKNGLNNTEAIEISFASDDCRMSAIKYYAAQNNNKTDETISYQPNSAATLGR